MPKRKVILLAIAGIVAVGTMLVARSLITPQEQQVAAPPPVQTTEILAASRDLPTGTMLRDLDMKWISWSSTADTSQFYIKGKDDSSRLVGAILRDGMRSGEPLLLGHVVQTKDHGFLAAVLQPGHRAMSVTITPASGVAGFIFPGDHVDVILTHSFSRKDSHELTERRVSETILADVRVLALDQKSDSMSADPKVAQLATIEVSPKQAEKLALAVDLVGPAGRNGGGSISLVLRSLAIDDASDQSAALGSTVPGANPLVVNPLKADEKSATWDSDVSSAFPTVNGDDGLLQRVRIMRGKESIDNNFERHR